MFHAFWEFVILMYNFLWIFCSVQFNSVAQSCPTLCDPMDCSLPVASVYGIFQARILEWIATSSSKESSWPRNGTRVSCITSGFFTTEPPGRPAESFFFDVDHVLSRFSHVRLCDLMDWSPPGSSGPFPGHLKKTHKSVLYVCISFCPANSFIGTIFLHSIYMC